MSPSQRHFVYRDRSVSLNLPTFLIGFWCFTEVVRPLLLRARSRAAASIPGATIVLQRQYCGRLILGATVVPRHTFPRFLEARSTSSSRAALSSPPPFDVSSPSTTSGPHIVTNVFVRLLRTWRYHSRARSVFASLEPLHGRAAVYESSS